MSAAAEDWAVRAADALVWPNPCLRRQVLLALAAHHKSGAFQVAFAALSDHLALDSISLWMALMELRRKGLIEARFGPVMTITLAIDFPTNELNQPAEVSGLPRMSMEGAE